MARQAVEYGWVFYNNNNNINNNNNNNDNYNYNNYNNNNNNNNNYMIHFFILGKRTNKLDANSLGILSEFLHDSVTNMTPESIC